MSAADVISFWREAGAERWFKRDEAFDASIAERFAGAVADAAAGRLDMWEATAEGTYGLLILLDQFPRNIHRGTPLAFASDPKARQVAKRALTKGYDRKMPPQERGFFYLPFEHSEDPADQARSIELFEAMGDAEQLKWAVIHKEIIDRLGRFPHRNPILGRTMTAQEQAFLDEGGFGG